MSAPSASTRSAQSFPSRNPRRRARQDNEEGGSLRSQPQRKRSKLSEAANAVTSHRQVNGDSDHPEANGHVVPAASGRALDFPLRGKAADAPGRHASKSDGTTVMTKNDNFTVRHLPALPADIRSNNSGYVASMLPADGYVVAVTHEQANVWDYASTISNADARVFSLPHPAKLGGPLPLGALVPSIHSRDTGLVVVNATTGKITYWQNIENADALNLFEQRRNGLDGSTGNLLPGETIVKIENVQHAGFVLIFSSGRVAQLLLVDPQSRPAVHVRFLRGSATPGMFSGLRYVLGGGISLKNVAAAKLRPSNNRRELELIIVNEDCNFQFWRADWPGQASLRVEADGAPLMHSIVDPTSDSNIRGIDFKARILDFAIVTSISDSGSTVMSNVEDDELDFVLLAEIARPGSNSYCLLEVSLRSGELYSRRTIYLQSAPSTPSTTTKWQPRLCVPKPFHTAFVVFEKAITLASLSTIQPGPSTQLLMDTGDLPEPFQDTVQLKTGENIRIVGCSEEFSAKGQNSSLMFFVKPFGVLRITAVEDPKGDNPVQRSPISAKSKIEQAVFYGHVANNPLNLFNTRSYNFSLEQAESAALALSSEILDSSSPFVSVASDAIGNHLDHRVKALQHLISHLLQEYPDISRQTKWLLLFDGEKLAAAQAVWPVIDESRNQFPDAYSTPSLVVSAVPDNMKTSYPTRTRKKSSQDNIDDEGDVSWWFIRDVGRFETLFPRVDRVVKEISKNPDYATSNNLNPIQTMSHADDVILEALEAAWKFRRDKAPAYGLGNEQFDSQGLLTANYGGVPHIWTSDDSIFSVNLNLCELNYKLMKSYLDHENESENPPTDDPPLIEKVVRDNSRLVNLSLKSCWEQIEQLRVSPDPQERSKGNAKYAVYLELRFTRISALKDISMYDAGVRMAEQYHDMAALVELVMDQLVLIKFNRVQGAQDPKFLDAKEKATSEQFNQYFQKFGSDWVEAVCAYHINHESYSPILTYGVSQKKLITKYLRAVPSRRKLAWLHDVRIEHDYAAASTALAGVATEERDLWCKKTELALAKLASVVSQGTNKDAKSSQHYKHVVDEMALVRIQETLYEHTRPAIGNAIDQAAELQLAMESYGRTFTKSKPALQSLLERGLETLIEHEAMDADQLVDVLTLMDERNHPTPPRDISGAETWLALQVLKSAGLSEEPAHYDMLLKTIWRRCFIRDDWSSLNNTLGKRDLGDSQILEDTHLFKTFYECFKTDLFQSVVALQPQDVLGVGSTASDHSARFPAVDLHEPLARDNSAEDEILRQHMKKHSLEQWVATARERAEAKLRADREQEAMAEADLEKALDQIVDQVAKTNMSADTSEVDYSVVLEGRSAVQSARVPTNGVAAVAAR